LIGIQGDHPAAAAACAESRELVQLEGDDRELAWIIWTGGIAALQREDLATAFDALAESRRLFRITGDIHGLVNALSASVTAAAVSAEPDAALDRANDFMAVAEPRGDRWTTALVFWSVGIAHWRLGNVQQAAEFEMRSLTLRQQFDDWLGSAVAVEVLTWTASRQGHLDRAATLMGAVRHALNAIGSSLAAFPYLMEDHQRCETELRTKLGDRAFAAAVDRGALLGIDEMVALATETKLVRNRATESSLKVATSPLTARERQIAELIAQGMSNRAIAASLVIAQRTAEGHVEHILVKLGFTSRSQIAGWVAARRAEPSAD
jgi:non-specific serine/threonine protein kinase